MRNSRNAASARGGFTLVEMLVAMTLVVMMMLMFAQIFGVAVGTMRNQRSLANNDQKARALTALLRSDLNAATFKSQLYSDSAGLVPLMAGDVVDPNQKGYFYIAENDPGSESDDILQFTIWATNPISGRARPIGRPDGSGASLVDLNQPDGDDGILGNGVTWSRAAEVSYFLRGGTLYRRVLLLRDPLPHDPLYSDQPTLAPTGQGVDLGGMSGYRDRLIPLGYDGSADINPPFVGDFWNDFDDSACWIYSDYGSTWMLHFNSIHSLDNNRGHENHPLGMPEHRFGHDPGLIDPGQPLEFLTTLPPTPQYIGRFTHEETSNPAFSFPGPANDPFSYEDGTGHTLLNNVVADYAGGLRAGEDIVMSGVEAFNIEVLDEGWSLSTGPGGGPNDRSDGGFPKFVNMGQTVYPAGNLGDFNNEFAADFSAARITNPGYGIAGNRFDTWHPDATIGGDNDPPYRPLYSLNPDLTVFVMGSNGASCGWRRRCAWDREWINGLRLPRCRHNRQRSDSPEWPLVPGGEVSDGYVIWRAIDNRIGLKMMRITIRYIDTQTGGLKQLSVYHSFVESR